MNLDKMKAEKELLETALKLINDSIKCQENIVRYENEAVETEKNINLTKFVREATIEQMMEYKAKFLEQKNQSLKLYNETIWHLALSPKI